MKRVICSILHDLVNEVTDKDRKYISSLVSVFTRKSKKYLPSVDVSLRTFVYDGMNGVVKLIGNMIYQGESHKIELEVPAVGGVSNVDISDVIDLYLDNVRDTFGHDILKEAGL